MKKHNVPLPKAYKDKGSSSDSKGKGQALMAKSNSSKEWILDSGASYHMGSSKEDFSSLNQSKVPHIFMGKKKWKLKEKEMWKWKMESSRIFSMFQT